MELNQEDRNFIVNTINRFPYPLQCFGAEFALDEFYRMLLEKLPKETVNYMREIRNGGGELQLVINNHQLTPIIYKKM